MAQNSVPIFYSIGHKVKTIPLLAENSPVFLTTRATATESFLEQNTEWAWTSRGMGLYLTASISANSLLFQIEVVSWMTRTALELICQSGLGTSFDTLVDDTAPHPYATSAKTLMYAASLLKIPLYQ